MKDSDFFKFMSVKKGMSLLLLVLASFSCTTKTQKTDNQNSGLNVEFVHSEAEKQVDVLVDGKLFTSYCWYDNVFKPILYPIRTSAGTEITRGFPLQPREGERTDHLHQVGVWLNYGDVNGNDFWGNGASGKRSSNGGIIKHSGIGKLSGGKGEGLMETKAVWLDSLDRELLTENTEYHFLAKGSTYIIDRITTLTAGKTIMMKDTKEGMFAIRVCRQLELPSNEEVVLTDAKGNPTTVKALTNEGVTGNYLSSEGVTGESVWSTRARWMDLYGSVGNEKVSIVICDHPKNQSYPTYWHARGYGLFSANPLGAKDFTQGKEELNVSISPGESVTFRYRVIVHSGGFLTKEMIDVFADEFSRKY